MHDISLHIDEVNSLVGRGQWGEQREPTESAIGIIAAQAHAAALYRHRVNACPCRPRRLGERA
jgi:hypothetical protein